MTVLNRSLLQDGHSDFVRAVVVVDGRVVTGSDDGTMREYSATDGSCLRVIQAHDSWVWALCSLGSGLLASGSKDSTIKIWQGGSCLRVLRGHGNSVSCLANSPDHSKLLSGSGDHSARLWDVGSGACERELQGHTMAVCAVLFVDSGRVASASNDKTIRLWSLATGACERVFAGHEEAVCSLVLLPALPAGFETTGVSAGAQATPPRSSTGWARVRPKLQSITVFKSKNKTSALAEPSAAPTETLSESGALARRLPQLTEAMIVSGAGDTNVCCWRACDGKRLALLEGHTDFINSVLLLPDGRLATGSDDQVQWGPAEQQTPRICIT